MSNDTRPNLLAGPSPSPVSSRTDAVSRGDGWSNALSGVGTSRDKRSGLTHSVGTLVDKTISLALWQTDGIARRILTALPEDVFREWGIFQNDPTQHQLGNYDEGIMQHTCTVLKARTFFELADVAARTTGGSILFIGTSGAGAPSSPLKPERIKTFDFLKVFDLGQIDTTNSKFDTNIASPTYGQILQYKVKTKVGGVEWEGMLDATRCIPFFGTMIPPSLQTVTNQIEAAYWGIPELQHIYEDLQDFRGAFSSVYAILQELVIGKYTIDDLDKILNDVDNGPALLKARLNGMSESKSLINAVLLGQDEKFERDSINLSAVPEVLDRAMMILSGITGYPVTKLFGRSAAGLNATGDGDQANYYDKVRAAQNAKDASMQKFADILAAAYGIGEIDHSWKWNSLYQQTPQQKNEAVRLRSEAFRTWAVGAQTLLLEGVGTAEELPAVIAEVFPEFAGQLTVGEPPAEPAAPAKGKSATPAAKASPTKKPAGKAAP